MTTSLPTADNRSNVHLKHVVGLVLTWVFALLPANLVPTIIGRLVGDYGVDVTVAGAVATGMTLANAAAALTLRPFAARGHRRLIARVGAALLIVPLGIALITLDATVIMAALVVGGIGSGAVIAASTAAVSATHNPDSATNTVMIVNRFVVAAAFFLIPLTGGGLQTAMIVIIVPGIVALFGAQWLPQGPRDDSSSEVDTRTDTIRLFESFEPQRVRFLSWLLALGFGAWSITDDGVFGLVEVLAANNIPTAGVDYVPILLGFSILCGLGGALIALPAATRLGRGLTLTILFAASLLAKLGLMIGTDQVLYTVSGCVWGFAFGAMLPIVFGLAAQMTRSGSSSVLVNGVYIFGVALGPLISSQILSAAGSAVLGVAMTTLGIVSAIPVVYVARTSQQRIGA